MKLALFDISDLHRPREVASLELGGAGSASAVEEDHRALLYDPARKLLVLPVTEAGRRYCPREPPAFHGAKVFTLGRGGFTLRAARILNTGGACIKYSQIHVLRAIIRVLFAL